MIPLTKVLRKAKVGYLIKRRKSEVESSIVFELPETIQMNADGGKKVNFRWRNQCVYNLFHVDKETEKNKTRVCLRTSDLKAFMEAPTTTQIHLCVGKTGRLSVIS